MGIACLFRAQLVGTTFARLAGFSYMTIPARPFSLFKSLYTVSTLCVTEGGRL